MTCRKNRIGNAGSAVREWRPDALLEAVGVAGDFSALGLFALTTDAGLGCCFNKLFQSRPLLIVLLTT